MAHYNNNMTRYRPIWAIVISAVTILWFTVGCDDYVEETFLLTDAEQYVCDLLNNDSMMLYQNAGDLSLFGPHWNDSQIETTFETTERIGSTWFSEDMEVEPDIYVFTYEADTVAAMEILSFNYNDSTAVLDSILIVYKYNADGTSDFSGISMDSLFITFPQSDDVYVQFGVGIVTESDPWIIKFTGTSILMADSAAMYRLADQSLSDFTSAPEKNYAANGRGFDLAVTYLENENVFIGNTDTTLRIELANDLNAGYMLFDRRGKESGDLALNVNNYMDINIWDESGSPVELLDGSISMQSLAYCEQIRTRAVYYLEDDIYLIQFLPHESMTTLAFRLAITGEE